MAMQAIQCCEAQELKLHVFGRGKTVEEVWNAIHTAEKRNAERNGASTPPLDQQQTVGSFLQSIGALDFGDSGIPSLPSSFLPPAPELQVSPRFQQACSFPTGIQAFQNLSCIQALILSKCCR